MATYGIERRTNPASITTKALLESHWENWIKYTDSSKQWLAQHFLNWIGGQRWREYSAIPGSYYTFRSDSDHGITLRELEDAECPKHTQRPTYLFRELISGQYGFQSWKDYLLPLREQMLGVDIEQENGDLNATIYMTGNRVVYLQVRWWVVRRINIDLNGAVRNYVDVDARFLPGMQFDASMELN